MNKLAILENLKQHLSLDKDSKVLIVGLGDTGFSVAKFLRQYGIAFAVTDSRTKPPFNDILLQEYPDIPVFTGGFDKAAFSVATHLVVSPGISLAEASIKKAICQEMPLVSDIDLFACATDKPVVAITGSNGKSTVTTMLGSMGNASGITTAIGGNLGTPALNLLDESVELYVLELSSFQLERSSVLNPKAATVLNISEDHLDRHIDMAGYAQEKQKIFMGEGAILLNEDDPIVKAMAISGRQIATFSTSSNNGFHLAHHQNQPWLFNANQPLMPQSDLQIEGLHNVANALAAFALGFLIDLPKESMCHALKNFKGLEHRMQKVAKIKNISWINDSKATNVGACVAALQGYQQKVILIAGGDAKGANMQDLIPAIKEKAKCVVLMGKDAPLIEQAINGCVPVYRANTILEAVEISTALANAGENVLLSPACASIDQYKNYQERGEKFITAVMNLAA